MSRRRWSAGRRSPSSSRRSRARPWRRKSRVERASSGTSGRRGAGRRARAFELTRLGGAPLALEVQRGKVVVVNFWASWCYPACYEEAPVLERNWRAYRDRDGVVIGVNIQDRVEAAQKFVRDFNLTFPNGRDTTGKPSVDYRGYGVPA